MPKQNTTQKSPVAVLIQNAGDPVEAEAQSPSITQEFNSNTERQIKQMQTLRGNLEAEAIVAQEEGHQHAEEAARCYKTAREARRRLAECDEVIISLKLVRDLQ